jgi:hypothetical protein
VNLQGKTVGGVLSEAEHWASGVVVGTGTLGDSVTTRLDLPIGGGEPGGLLHRESRGQDMVSGDVAGRGRAEQAPDHQTTAVVEAVRTLVLAGKTKAAIMRDRELNGTTLVDACADMATR